MKEEESILRFLNDEMDDEELTSFNKRMIHEPELAESVDHSRRIKNILNDDTVEFSNKVRAVIESKRKKKSFTSLLVAASTVIVLAASIYFLFFSAPPIEEMVLSYLNPYPDVITSRSETSLLNLKAYNSGNYSRAIEELKGAFEKEKDPIIVLYLGVSYLMSDDSENAMIVLESVPYENTIYASDFIWYQGLALIRLSRFEEAKSKLKTLQKESPFYSKRSSQLLDNLE